MPFDVYYYKYKHVDSKIPLASVPFKSEVQTVFPELKDEDSITRYNIHQFKFMAMIF